MDHPLGFALNSLQAFAVCLHVIHSYTSWREYGTEVPYYRWTEVSVPGTDVNTLNYLEFHMDAVCEPQSQNNGLQLPPAFRQHVWNQLAVESGYVADCVKKRDAVQCWEAEFATIRYLTVTVVSLLTPSASKLGIRYRPGCDALGEQSRAGKSSTSYSEHGSMGRGRGRAYGNSSFRA